MERHSVNKSNYFWMKSKIDCFQPDVTRVFGVEDQLLQMAPPILRNTTTIPVVPMKSLESYHKA